MDSIWNRKGQKSANFFKFLVLQLMNSWQSMVLTDYMQQHSTSPGIERRFSCYSLKLFIPGSGGSRDKTGSVSKLRRNYLDIPKEKQRFLRHLPGTVDIEQFPKDHVLKTVIDSVLLRQNLAGVFHTHSINI